MKRLIGMMLVLVVGCETETESPKTTVESGDTQEESVGSDLAKQFVDPNLTTTVEPQTTESSIFEMDSFDDVEPDLVRNENGEVIEFTGFSETDADLEQLRDMPELETLSLIYCEKITDAGLVHLKNLTNLQYLDLMETQITDTGLVHLKNLTNLQSLGLMKTQITDTGLVHLKDLTNLKDLGLMETQITDAGLVHLKDLTNLQDLDLTGCENITDAGLVHLKNLTNLKDLSLAGCENITDSGVAELQKALPNCEISR